MSKRILAPIGLCLLLGIGLTVLIGCQEALVVEDQEVQFDSFTELMPKLSEEVGIVIQPFEEGFSKKQIEAAEQHGYLRIPATEELKEQKFQYLLIRRDRAEKLGLEARQSLGKANACPYFPGTPFDYIGAASFAACYVSLGCTEGAVIWHEVADGGASNGWFVSCL